MEKKPRAKMLIEHGLIPGHTLCPDQPGMENSSTIIPDHQKMNPNCVCPTRTCPLHGFCEYCAQHHAELSRALGEMGLGEHCHFHHCKQDKLIERFGPGGHHRDGPQGGRGRGGRGKAGPGEWKGGVLMLRIGDRESVASCMIPRAGMEFLVAAQDHYAPGVTTLLTKYVIGVRALDAAESGPEGAYPFEQSGKFGNNNYPNSNLHQWLNAREEQWYHPTHDRDQPPVAGAPAVRGAPLYGHPGLFDPVLPGHAAASGGDGHPGAGAHQKDPGRAAVCEGLRLPAQPDGDEQGG